MPERDDPRIINSERIVLRPHRASDLDACAALWGDADVTRYITGRPSTREETWARILRYIGHWSALGFGFWALEDKASGRFAGEVGFADFKRDVTPSFEGAVEAGWLVASWAQGKGYATEAMRAGHQWLEARQGRVRTVCMIDPENLASIRVAEKCGFREWTRTTYKGQPTVLFER